MRSSGDPPSSWVFMTLLPVEGAATVAGACAGAGAGAEVGDGASTGTGFGMGVAVAVKLGGGAWLGEWVFAFFAGWAADAAGDLGFGDDLAGTTHSCPRLPC